MIARKMFKKVLLIKDWGGVKMNEKHIYYTTLLAVSINTEH